MKNLLIVCAVIVLAGCVAGSVSASEISKSDLSNMGLGSMHRLSDADGLAVRGMGVYIYGGSVATHGTSSSVNTYAAASDNSPAKAIGANASVTGTVIHGHIIIFNVGAGISAAHTP